MFPSPLHQSKNVFRIRKTLEGDMCNWANQITIRKHMGTWSHRPIISYRIRSERPTSTGEEKDSSRNSKKETKQYQYSCQNLRRVAGIANLLVGLFV